MLKKIITVFLITTILTSIAACSGGDTTPDSTTKEPTTAEVTTPELTTEEPTTEEPTTEEPSTEYQVKGKKVFIPIEKKDLFMDLTVEAGYSLCINDIYPEGEEYETDRSVFTNLVAIALFMEYYPDEYIKFSDKYSEPGLDYMSISYEDNAVIEYNGDKKFYFHFVEEKEGKAIFDVYVVD